MKFIGIESVLYAARDMNKSKRFFSDWGLKKIKDGSAGVVFETKIGSQIILRPRGHKDLPKAAARGVDFREVIWGVSSKRDLAKIKRELAPDHDLRIDKDGTIHTTDPNGFGIGFRVWQHKRGLKPDRGGVNTPGHKERINEIGRVYDRAHPIRMGHIVFFTPDLKTTEEFYKKRLGFVLSDRYAGGAGVFLRYAAESDHHNLFLINRPGAKPELQHVAFEVSDIHEVFGGGMHFDKCGWKVEVGPGRHPISSAYFWYFKNPCGGAVEYFCDSDYVTEDWKPTAYRINRFSEWHMAEGIRVADDDKQKKRPAMAAT